MRILDTPSKVRQIGYYDTPPFIFNSCWCGGGSVLSRAVFVASDLKVGAGAGCDVLHEFHGDGFVGGVCAVGFDVL